MEKRFSLFCFVTLNLNLSLLLFYVGFAVRLLNTALGPIYHFQRF
jgi:hypothetical protein